MTQKCLQLSQFTLIKNCCRQCKFILNIKKLAVEQAGRSHFQDDAHYSRMPMSSGENVLGIDLYIGDNMINFLRLITYTCMRSANVFFTQLNNNYHSLQGNIFYTSGRFTKPACS